MLAILSLFLPPVSIKSIVRITRFGKSKVAYHVFQIRLSQDRTYTHRGICITRIIIPPRVYAVNKKNNRFRLLLIYPILKLCYKREKCSTAFAKLEIVLSASPCSIPSRTQ